MAAGLQPTLRYVVVVAVAVERRRVVVEAVTLAQQAQAEEKSPLEEHFSAAKVGTEEGIIVSFVMVMVFVLLTALPLALP